MKKFYKGFDKNLTFLTGVNLFDRRECFTGLTCACEGPVRLKSCGTRAPARPDPIYAPGLLAATSA